MRSRLEDEALLTVDDLARYLNVSRRWVYDAANRQVMPSFKVGHFLRFEKRAIEEWLDSIESSTK